MHVIKSSFVSPLENTDQRASIDFFSKIMRVNFLFIRAFGSTLTVAAEAATIERNHLSNPTPRHGSIVFRTAFNDEKHSIALWKHELVL